ncbi:TIGR01777 family oxidoreductase [Geojedonia litorea]|uniref:TIGR01777 family oxidoreductase n=1 Tax=Geojedonia litorea TaxID=1268269 RepID=A0ABV9MXZ5_9FLAO
MKVLITGATGLIGKAIVQECHSQGISVNYLTTSKHKLASEANYKGFYWNPSEAVIDSKCFEDVNAIINLAGASISKRWTDAYKKEILHSRIQSLELLKTFIENHSHNITHLISASAIGVYPDSLTNYYEETFTEHSQSFLGQVVNQWEAKADEFSNLNIKVSKVRIGLVLAKDGGALPELVKPTQFGLGAAFGSGDQWQSWIHIEDLAALFVHVLTQSLVGTYNAVGPNPVTNYELTRAVAKTLKRPLLLPNIPKAILKLILGEMHILLFESQRVSSKKIEVKQFLFKYHHLEPALQNLLN